MPLSDAEKTDIRRFCGYPAYGDSTAGMQNWRFFQTYGLLEFRMNNLSDSELGIVRRCLGTLLGLEVAIPQSSINLDTDQAAVWTHNRDEVRDRMQLYDNWCRRLCAFLGIPPGARLATTGVTLVI